MLKRGQFEVLQISLILEIVIAVAVASLLVYSAVSFDVFSKFKHEYADADLTMLMDQVVSAPGPIEVKYPLSSKYLVTISGGDVKIAIEPTLFSRTDSYLVLSKDSSGNVEARRVLM